MCPIIHKLNVHVQLVMYGNLKTWVSHLVHNVQIQLVMFGNLKTWISHLVHNVQIPLCWIDKHVHTQCNYKNSKIPFIQI